MLYNNKAYGRRLSYKGKYITKSISLLLILAVMITLMPVPAIKASKRVYGSGFTNIDRHGSDWFHHYDTSFLNRTDTGYMRVEFQDYTILAEYFDKNMKLIERKIIPFETPMTEVAGFYNGSDAYYLVFGDGNPAEYPFQDIENIRVVKYDKKWNRIAAASVKGAEITVPFQTGKVAITESCGYLFIHTSQKLFVSEDGLNHQCNLTVQIKTSDMTVTNLHNKTFSFPEYCGHAFIQNAVTDDEGNVLMLDQGDAYPRAAQLCRYLKGDLEQLNTGIAINVMEYAGNLGTQISATIGDLGYSDTSYLTAGVSAKQTKAGILDPTQNIYITSTKRNNFTTEETTTYWITDYLVTDTNNVPTAPYLVKLATNDFLLIWGENIETSDAKLGYIRIDGEGKPIGFVKYVKGNLSDCRPIVDSGKLTWYLQNDDKVTLCQLDYEKSEITTREYYDDFYLSTSYVLNKIDGILVTWPAVQGATKYLIERSNLNNGLYDTTTFEVSADKTSYLDTDNLKVNGQYLYRVIARVINDPAGSHYFSNMSIYRVADYGPAAVTQVPEGVRISWNNLYNEASVYIYRKHSPNENWGKPIAVLTNSSAELIDSFTRSYTDTSIEVGKTYYYLLRTAGGTTNETMFRSYDSNGVCITTREIPAATQIPTRIPTPVDQTQLPIARATPTPLIRPTLVPSKPTEAPVNRQEMTDSKLKNILPVKPILTAIKAGKKSFTVRWKKITEMNGYELQYSLKKSFAKAKKLKLKSNTTKTAVKKLKAKKKYYIRIRSYLKSDWGIILYSSWSKVKKVKVK